jgi:NTE family protein
MGDDLAAYRVPHTLACLQEQTSKLAEIATRLASLDRLTQERLINFGYAACDTHMRMWVDPKLSYPVQFSYPTAGVG